MTKLFLIRHCEAYGNIYRRLDGIRNTGVTPLGERQIKYLSDRFADVPLDVVYSSALERAWKTAKGISDASGAPLRCCLALHERDMGLFDGRSWYEAAELYPEVFAAWQADLDGYVLPGGESARGAGRRFRQAVETICAQHPDSSVAVVAHSMVIKSLLESLCSASVHFSNNTAVSLLYVDGGDIRIEYINDDRHLPECAQAARQRWFKNGADLRNYSLRYVYPQMGTPGSTSMPQVQDGQPVLLTAYENDDMVGHARFHFNKDTCIVDELLIEPEFRRLGFATQLIGEMLYRAEGRGGISLLLTASERGEAIHALAAKNGFQRTDGGYIKAI